MTDPLLVHTNDGGEISYVNGILEMSAGLETAFYLSILGGNERDSGIEKDDPLQYWANLNETKEVNKFRSRTQNILLSLPATTSNLLILQDGVKQDLAWFVSEGVADDVDALVTMTGLNRVQIASNITVGDNIFSFSIAMDWNLAA